jgi:hypothetical protein
MQLISSPWWRHHALAFRGDLLEAGHLGQSEIRYNLLSLAPSAAGLDLLGEHSRMMVVLPPWPSVLGSMMMGSTIDVFGQHTLGQDVWLERKEKF